MTRTKRPAFPSNTQSEIELLITRLLPTPRAAALKHNRRYGSVGLAFNRFQPRRRCTVGACRVILATPEKGDFLRSSWALLMFCLMQ